MKKFLLILPVLSGVLWGSAGIFIRGLTAAGMNSLTIVSTRMAVSVVIMLLFILLYDKSLLKIRLRDLWIFCCAGIISMTGMNFFYNTAVAELSLSLAAVLLSLSPVFVIFLAAVIFKEKITLRKVGCTLFAIFGCFLVSGILEAQGSVKWSLTGILIGLLSAFFYAFYSIFSRTAADKGYHIFTTIFYSLLTASIALIPFTDWTVVGNYLSSDPTGSSMFLFLHALCCSVLPYVLYNAPLSYIETGKAAILASGGEPSSAMIFGFFFFGEIPTLLSLAGLIITILALSVLCLPEKASSSEKATQNSSAG